MDDKTTTVSATGLDNDKLSTDLSYQTNISIYSVKPATLSYENDILQLMLSSGKVIFKRPISEVIKIKNYGDFFYIYFKHKSYSLNFSSTSELKNERKAVLLGPGELSASSSGITHGGGREVINSHAVEDWITLFNTKGIEAKQKKFYTSKWLLVFLAIVVLINVIKIISSYIHMLR